MAWTKRTLVELAYEELGVSAALDYGLTEQQVQTGVNRLDALMSRLYQQGYRLSYNQPVEANGSDPDDDAGIPPGAHEAVYLQLALRLAPVIGKMVPPETQAAARKAINAMGLEDFSLPRVRRDVDAVPAGQGNRRTRWPSDPYLEDDYADPLSANQPGNLGEY